MSNKPALLRLDGDQSTLLLTHDNALPRLVWLGDRLSANLAASDLANHTDSALAFATLDAFHPLDLLPQASTGYMGSPALNGHRGATHFAHQFTLENVQQQDNSIVLQLADTDAELSLSMRISLDPLSDVVCIETSIRNDGRTNFDIDWLASATLPLPTHFTQCTTQHGRWGLENQSLLRPICPGRIDISNMHGRTSHEHVPSVVCAEANFNEDNGDVLFAHLAWSGNFSFRIEQLSDGTSYLQAGVLLKPGEQVLEPAETLTCPPLIVTRGPGLNTCTQRFHRYTRAHVLPKWTRTPRPIHANSWEAMYFDHDVESLLALVDAAASIGAERFVLDDGWFLHRRNDKAGLGDWYVDTSIYPDGLTPLVERVRAHNMQFGLWFEPEMINPDSDLYRAHPDWVLQVAGIDTPLARDQLALDISREDVSNYLFERITSLVRQYAIDYIKWDMNRDLVLPGDGIRSRASKQPLALYALMERITNACPELQIETCASGGARIDMGVLQHTGRAWTSDNIDPIDRAQIQQGFLRFMPAEIMGAHVGHQSAHLTGRHTDLHTRAIVALQGQFGFELDARKLDADEVLTLQHYTQLYKTHRSWLADANYWQLPCSHSEMIASGQVSQDCITALFSVVIQVSLRTTRPGTMRLRGLKPDMRYVVSLASANAASLAPFNKAIPDWCIEPVTTSGDLLMKIGLPLPVMPPQSALLIQCVAQDTQGVYQ